MEVIQFKHLIFISTETGCYMVDSESNTGKSISGEAFDLISEISELKNDLKDLV